jgi:hypothetical protein
MRLFNSKLTALPVALAALVGLTLLSACSREEENLSAPVPHQPEALLQLGLEVSSFKAGAGDRISVAVTNFTGAPLGALQGRVLFDPSALRFVGQDLDPENVSILNTRSAAKGFLTVVTINARAHALPARTAVLAFEVIRANYSGSLRYQVSAVGTPDGVELRHAQVIGAREALDLAVSATAKLQSDEDWGRAIDPVLAGNGGTILTVPGANVSGLVYGDCNESGGNVNVFDVLCIQRVAANLDQPISGTDAPAHDAVLASNVSPSNCPSAVCVAGEFGEPSDPTPPGVGAGGSATNIDSRTLNVLDALDVQRCAAGLAGVCPPSTAASPWSTVVNQIIPGREASQFSRTDSNIVCPISASLHLGRGKRYILQKTPPVNTTVCDVGSDGGSAVVLTIDAGVLLVADSTTLVIHRNAQIFANGTVAEPILMTCAQGQPAPLGNGTVTKGCWGGLYLDGNAPINNGSATSPAIGGRQGGGANEATGEGSSGLYGGDNATDNSGVLRFVIVEGGGTRITPTNERNGFTMQGVGSGTTLDYLMSTNGLDDGIEFFGGTVNVKHMWVENTEDDGFDWVGGWRGKLQFGIVRGCAPNCDNGIEGDNFGIDGGAQDPEASPRSSPTIYNVTLLGVNSGTPITGNHGMLLRQNTAGTLRNLLVFGFKSAFDIDSTGQAIPSTFTTAGLICNRLGGAGNGQTPIGDDALSIRFGYFGQSSLGDADPDAADPRNLVGTGGAAFNCGGYGHDGTNLEAAYMAVASNNLFGGQGNATGFMVDPWGTVPDFRLRPGSPALICSTPPNDGFFDVSATYCGAAPPQNTVSVNLPWFSGWTLPRVP